MKRRDPAVDSETLEEALTRAAVALLAPIVDRLAPPCDRLFSWLDRRSTLTLLYIGMVAGACSATGGILIVVLA